MGPRSFPPKCGVGSPNPAPSCATPHPYFICCHIKVLTLSVALMDKSTLHCILHITHCTQNTEHCTPHKYTACPTLHCVHNQPQTAHAHCTPYTQQPCLTGGSIASSQTLDIVHIPGHASQLGRQYGVHCVPCSEYCVVCSVYCLLSTVYCAVCTVRCILRHACCVICTVYCVLRTVYCVLCTVYCTVCTVPCELCNVYCALFTVYGVLCSVYYVIHSMYCDQYVNYYYFTVCIIPYSMADGLLYII